MKRVDEKEDCLITSWYSKQPFFYWLFQLDDSKSLYILYTLKMVVSPRMATPFYAKVVSPPPTKKSWAQRKSFQCVNSSEKKTHHIRTSPPNPAGILHEKRLRMSMLIFTFPSFSSMTLATSGSAKISSSSTGPLPQQKHMSVKGMFAPALPPECIMA